MPSQSKASVDPSLGVRSRAGALALLVALVPAAAVAQSETAPITPEEAADHADTEQTVCGAVADAAYVPEMDGRPTFLNFGQAWPDQVLSVVIWADAREEFPEPPELMFREADVCVTGMIETTDEGPRIVVEDPEAIVTQEETEG